MNPIVDPIARLTRRTLLAGAGATGLAGAIGLTSAAPAAAEGAAQDGLDAAAALGYTRLAFSDDFTGPQTVDLSGRGRPGYNWYTDLPWSGGVTPADLIDFDDQDSVMYLRQAWENNNVALCTVSPTTGNGQVFQYGYFEARIRFDPSLGHTTVGYPSFWSAPRGQLVNPSLRPHGEIDFFEAYHAPYEDYTGFFVGTLHDAQPRYDGSWNYRNIQNRNNYRVMGLTSYAWHRYGALWQPGKVTWYLDGKQMSSVSYGPGQLPSASTWDTASGADVSQPGTFSIVDQRASEGIGLILGTGVGWPMDVDWVRVWQ